MAVSPLRRQALLEREEALDALRAAWEQAAAGHGRLVLVGGEAGAGKTAVVRGFCAEVNAPVLHGQCDPLFTPRPLGAFLDVLPGVGAAHEIVPELVRATAGPAVVVLEDVHWADEATLDALRLLARKVEVMPLLVLATFRDDELDRLHPLRVVLGELATAPSIERLSIPRLSPAAVAELADGSAVAAEEVYRVTGGNAFFVTEVLAAPDGELPVTVRDAVLARGARLGIQARALVEAVAIVPPRAEPWLLDAVGGESTEAIDECVASGMLVARGGAVEFRHELARIAVVESIQPVRAAMLHRLALAALEAPPFGSPDYARLAHHADAAGDWEAVLRFAVAAAERATELGAHREAAAQYGRALRFADDLPVAERAELLERQSQAFYLTDDQVKAIAVLDEAIVLRQALGDVRGAASGRAQVVPYLACRGHMGKAEEAARDAIATLAGLPPGPELAAAYGALALVHLSDGDNDDAIVAGRKACELAEQLGERDALADASITLGAAEVLRDGPDALPALERALELARASGRPELVARALTHMSYTALRHLSFELAERSLDEGLEICADADLDLWRLSLLEIRARWLLDRGDWTEAATTAALLIDEPRDSPSPHVTGRLVLALVRARRGDPGTGFLLDEAGAAEGSAEELRRVCGLAATTAEIAWLQGRTADVRDSTQHAFDTAIRRGSAFWIGKLAYWRRKNGLVDELPDQVAAPYDRQLQGDWEAAAQMWRALRCPYEEALALSESDDERALRHALDLFRELGAGPPATMVTRRLRVLGVRGVARGPRASTSANAASLTTRELDVLRLVADGLRNAAIAERLFLSTRTVDHHVSSVLRKLEVGSRGEAVAEGRRLGLLGAAALG